MIFRVFNFFWFAFSKRSVKITENPQETVRELGRKEYGNLKLRTVGIKRRQKKSVDGINNNIMVSNHLRKYTQIKIITKAKNLIYQ